MRPVPVRPSRRRRGVTLLEMLVVVALLVLMMSILVQVFRSATGAISEQRAYAQLDQTLRRLDGVIRRDLAGVTAKMTPPNNPRDNRGYFEYIENSLADAQGEDTDDCLRFTAKAPDGQPFTGRVWVPTSQPPPFGGAKTLRPIPISSQYAEIIYFLRNGNLYRRVKLIAPGIKQITFAPPIDPNGFSTRSGSLAIGNMGRTGAAGTVPLEPAFNATTQTETTSRFGFATDLLQPTSAFPSSITTGTQPGTGINFAVVGWNLNDISARPSDFSVAINPATGFRLAPNQQPMFSYSPIPNTLGDLTRRERRIFNPRFADDYFGINPATGNMDLFPDGTPDDLDGNGVPDFYPTMYPQPQGIGNSYYDTWTATNGLNLLLIQGNSATASPADVLAFPFVYHNAYSNPLPSFNNSFGAPTGTAPSFGRRHTTNPSTANVTNDPFGLTYLPLTGATLGNHAPLLDGDNVQAPTTRPTWWGFPTWRETLHNFWTDPIKRLNDPATATYYTGALARTAMPAPDLANAQSVGMSAVLNFPSGNSTLPWWLPPTPTPSAEFPNDGSGTAAFSMPPEAVWEDDLIASDVRSFDVKAFDPYAGDYNRYLGLPAGSLPPLKPGYYDLGYMSAYTVGSTNFDFTIATPGIPRDLSTGEPQGFGHEGRIPPLTADFRADAQWPGQRPNLGDDRVGVVRLVRTWDSWSTTYTTAPAQPNDPSQGPVGGALPAIASYPAPYPSPLRGIQIQIRIVDPGNKRIKVLTIRQDFADKL